MTLTSLARKNGGKPPPKHTFDKWTLGAAVEQLRLYLPAYGRKMLRVCLMLLREERQVMHAVRVLDRWQTKAEGRRAHMNHYGRHGGHEGWSLQLIDNGAHVGMYFGASPDEARIVAARGLVASDGALAWSLP